jgi:hypothetical protein
MPLLRLNKLPIDALENKTERKTRPQPNKNDWCSHPNWIGSRPVKRLSCMADHFASLALVENVRHMSKVRLSRSFAAASACCLSPDLRPVRLAYQPPASSTFLSEQISHQQPANSTFLSEQTSTSHQPPANRIGC